MSYSEFLGWCKWYELRNKSQDEPTSSGAIDLDSMSPEEVKRALGG